MSVKINGLDELQKQLNHMKKAAKELDGTHEISFDKLFTFSFMRKYTNFTTIDELLASGGFQANTNEEFENIPEDELDEYIAKTTKFNCWQDMLEEATSQYVAKKLGF